ncbi:MAG: sulfite exporter TauE/SafE family protein [Burkholderiales bacterium]|nr:sulfite exporter TauE/SafE family protein [Burkholderiales bacterium]
MTEWWWAYLGLGAIIGFLAGMLGIGGGFAIVPALALIYAAKGYDPAHVLHLAIGTAMATILFTSASSVWSHHRRGAINWSIVRMLVPGVLAGTFGGALIAGSLDTRVLAVLFTALVYFLAARLMFGGKPQPDRTLPGPAGMAVAGGVIGSLSSLAAIAGASFTVPFLMKRNVRVHEAVPIATAVGWPLALAGTAGYVVTGWTAANLPEHTVGYVYLPAMAWIAAASMLTAPLGVRVAHRMPANLLKKVFALFLFVLATRMLVSLL